MSIIRRKIIRPVEKVAPYVSEQLGGPIDTFTDALQVADGVADVAAVAVQPARDLWRIWSLQDSPSEQKKKAQPKKRSGGLLKAIREGIIALDGGGSGDLTWPSRVPPMTRAAGQFFTAFVDAGVATAEQEAAALIARAPESQRAAVKRDLTRQFHEAVYPGLVDDALAATRGAFPNGVRP